MAAPTVPQLVRAGGLAVALAVFVGNGSAAEPPLPAPTTNVRPLATAVEDGVTFIHPQKDLAFAHVRAAGATFVRISVPWKQIAPAPLARTKPRGHVVANPADRRYDWEGIDAEMRSATRKGLVPIATVYSAPLWATKPAGNRPALRRADQAAFAQFALAAARRYSGTFEDLPRVTFWEAWNEPNVGPSALKAGAAAWYRELVNRFAAAVHSVHSDNIVIAGSTSPFETTSAIAPLHFMRDLLCIAGGEKPRPTCSNTTHFDVWAHHPYTSGGPTHQAVRGDDVSIGDLPEMRRILDAALRAHHVISNRRVRFWVTEFSWETKPPDPKGVPLGLQTRWTAEALYRMWSAGVSLVTWFRIRDDPVATSYYQSGLYFRGSSIAKDRAKPTFRAFRFPFVAFGSGDRVFVWGRTPYGARGRVAIQQVVSGEWRTLGLLSTDRFGIFSRIYRTPRTTQLRAQLADGSDASVPFSLQVPPDRVYPVFGS